MAGTRAKVTPIAPDFDFDVETEDARIREQLAKEACFRVAVPVPGEEDKHVVTMTNARLLDWKLLQQVGRDPVEFIAYVIESEEDQRALINASMSGETMRQLMRQYYEHFGITEDMLITGSDATREQLNRANRRKQRRR